MKKINLYEIFKAVFVTILGLLFITLMALKKIPLPGTSIQMSLQSLSISLLVIALQKKAFNVVLIYLAVATIGFPVLAGGTSNIYWLFSPTGGYYIGFLISSFFLSRLLIIVRPHHFLKTWFCLSFNESVILFCGFIVLSFYSGLIQAFWIGIWPFLLGALLKITFATICYSLKDRLTKEKIIEKRCVSERTYR